MEKLLLFLSVILLVASSAAGPDKPEKLRILLLSPFAGPSHMNVYQALVEPLAERGHDVTVLSGLPPRNMLDGKIKELQLQELEKESKKAMSGDHLTYVISTITSNSTQSFQMFLNNAKMFYYFFTATRHYCKIILEDPALKQVIEEGPYDVVIHSGFMNDCTLPLASARLTKTGIILATPCGLMSYLAYELGIPNPYSVFPNLALTYSSPMTFLERTVNALASFGFHILEFGLVRQPLNSVIQEVMPGLPSITEAKLTNTSLLLIARTSAVDGPIPSLPFYQEIGCIPCRPGKTIEPEDLKDFVDNSGDAGFVYVSFGSVIPEENIPEEKRQIILDSLAKLPQRVIWKFKKPIENLPKNVKIVSWAPQQDILAHPKIRAFVTHGGHLSLDETTFHGVPVISMPVFGDQFTNAAHSESKGIGKILNWKDLSVDTLYNTITEVTNNPSYKENAADLSKRMKDQPQTPKERATFWVEYVARHKGAFHLRPDMSHLNWAQYFLLDVFAFLAAILFVSFYIFYKIVCCICCRGRGKSASKKLKKK